MNGNCYYCYYLCLCSFFSKPAIMTNKSISDICDLIALAYVI